MGAHLPRAFFARDVLEVAPDCIGKVLVAQSSEGIVAARIVESEAYRGPEDQAAHSRNGLRTARTEVMFGEPGHVYMFRLYGSSWAFNIVTGNVGEPQVVLLRGVEPIEGVHIMAARRRIDPHRREISNGPGKLCQAMGFNGEHYGCDLVESGTIYLTDGGAEQIGTSRRINIDYAGIWAERPWRFFERGNRYVSVPPRI
ncbi:MAG: DNA-3-methyladenine glycosylase [Polyangiaceae bacterium]|nr:DNA-3-methyladenine glycosylase [Polyangiaceae bacterium]